MKSLLNLIKNKQPFFQYLIESEKEDFEINSRYRIKQLNRVFEFNLKNPDYIIYIQIINLIFNEEYREELGYFIHLLHKRYGENQTPKSILNQIYSSQNFDLYIHVFPNFLDETILNNGYSYKEKYVGENYLEDIEDFIKNVFLNECKVEYVDFHNKIDDLLVNKVYPFEKYNFSSVIINSLEKIVNIGNAYISDFDNFDDINLACSKEAFDENLKKYNFQYISNINFIKNRIKVKNIIELSKEQHEIYNYIKANAIVNIIKDEGIIISANYDIKFMKKVMEHINLDSYGCSSDKLLNFRLSSLRNFNDDLGFMEMRRIKI